ncbi:MAG: M48 family peptidase [Nitrospirae bacterium]|nr:MAG: M48 family peptidase [Nitrospirota bacterium]
MNTERSVLVIQGLEIEVLRKNIKNLHLGVYPPDGRVRVSAPCHLDDETISLAVISRLGWIRRHQKRFAEQERESQREMVTGESHYFAGRRYRLDVIVRSGRPKVRIRNSAIIELIVPPEADRDAREQVLEHWYRTQLRRRIPPLLEKWQPVIGVNVNEVRIRKMKTLWGSCNIEARRIWLNLELMKKSPRCLEYILVHEMVHLLERCHNERFHALMDRFLPDWPLRRDELNRAPLAYCDWDY